VGATRPHALVASVRAMFEYEPEAVLAAVRAPIVSIRWTGQASEVDPVTGRPGVTAIELPAPGHNLLRYRPAEVAAAILGR
jgi:branched-subunit amino acid transport protein